MSLVPKSTGLTPAALAAIDTTPQEIIRRWLAALSPESARSYTRSMRAFAGWALSDTEAPPERALELLVTAGAGKAHALVGDWRDHLLDAGKSTATAKLRVSGVASLVKACRRAGLITWRLEQVAPRVEPREDRSGPHRGDVERMIERLDQDADNGSPLAKRNAAILRLLYTAALRVSEVTSLLRRHVQLDHPDGPVVLAKRKGQRERQRVLISKGCADSLRRWFTYRGNVAGPLFQRLDAAAPTNAITAIGAEGVRRMVRARAKEAGIKTIVRPHGLRHSAATFVAGQGSIATLMATGGWKSLSAAQVYIDRQATERRRALAILEV